MLSILREKLAADDERRRSSGAAPGAATRPLRGLVALVDLDTEDGSYHLEYDDFSGYNGFDRGALSDMAEKAGFAKPSFETVYVERRDRGEGVKDYPLFVMEAEAAERRSYRLDEGDKRVGEGFRFFQRRDMSATGQSQHAGAGDSLGHDGGSAPGLGVVEVSGYDQRRLADIA
jgi:hypothetical protein